MCGSWVIPLHGKSCGKCCVPLVLLFLCSVFSGIISDDFGLASLPLGFEVNAFDRNKNWVSENEVFAFGFLEIEGAAADEFVVGIRYNLQDKASNLPVWTVGGGLSVSVNSTLRLAMDGRLVLINNPSNIILWSSNTSGLGVQKTSLLNNGNLVLLGSKDEVIWDSFSCPTNTLLPGQSLSYPQNLRASSTRSISSYYNLVISQSGELALVWERNVTYWRSHFSSFVVAKESRFDSNGVLGIYDDDNKAIWSVSAKDYGDSSVILRHLRIDRDGNLRIYSWDNVNHAWKVVWQAVQDQCKVFGSCGLYSVCGYNSSSLVCDCLYSDSLEWGIRGSVGDSGGLECKKMVDLGNCRMHSSMLVMKQTFLYGLYPPHDVDMLLSEMACKEYCSNDTSCIAATSINNGSGLCTIKRTSFISGYKTPNTPAVSFLKVCSIPQAVATQGVNQLSNSDSNELHDQRGSRKKLIEAIALIVLLTICVILSIQVLIFLVLYWRREIEVKTRISFGKDARMNAQYSVLIRLSFEEIKELTKNFATQLGTSVFQGMLPNKTPIVAKFLEEVVVSEKEFRAAVSVLSGTHHRNLVSVKGFCFEPTNKILLYEHVPNGSLDKWLFYPKEKSHNQLIWQQRLDIALGVARAIAYLHSECQICITHGNLKLENILLDENLVPKVTDFGLRNFLKKQEVSTSESPSERDIYMLGKIFLQIVTCKRDVLGENMQHILHQVDQERELVGDDNMHTIERIIRISFWCIQNQPFLRPSIGEVVKVLEGTLSADLPPSNLAFRHDDTIETEVGEM